MYIYLHLRTSKNKCTLGFSLYFMMIRALNNPSSTFIDIQGFFWDTGNPNPYSLSSHHQPSMQPLAACAQRCAALHCVHCCAWCPQQPAKAGIQWRGAAAAKGAHQHAMCSYDLWTMSLLNTNQRHLAQKPVAGSFWWW